MAIARLIILAASVGDGARYLPQPAHRRYAGRLWRALIAADQDGLYAHPAYISPFYGFGDAYVDRPHFSIPMTTAREQELIAGGIDRRWPDANAMNAHEVMSGMLRVDGARRYDEVAIVGPPQHQRIVAALVIGFRRVGQIAAHAQVVTHTGPLASMQAAITTFVLAGRPVPAPRLLAARSLHRAV